jgi:hypothetical protein
MAARAWPALQKKLYRLRDRAMNPSRRNPVLAAVPLCLALVSGPAFAGIDPAGVFKRVAGNVCVVRDGASIPAAVGMAVQTSDQVLTGADGSAGLSFEDASLLSLGPSTSLSIDRFSFDTATYDGAFELSLAKGRLAVISGKIARHLQDAMKVKTPSSILGVRGNEFVVEVGGRP